MFDCKLSYAIPIARPLCYTTRMRLNRRSRLTTLSRSGAQAALLFLFTGTITLSIGLNLFLSLTGITALQASAGAESQVSTALAGMGLAASIALYGIVTPLVEEFVFRGMFYAALCDYLLRKIGPTANAGISSILFGIYHMNLAQGIYAFLMGMTFCLAYELTGQFLSAWLLHAACNIIALLLSQSVNGTNAFTQLCTWPWTIAFLAIAVAAFVCLYRLFHK